MPAFRGDWKSYRGRGAPMTSDLPSPHLGVVAPMPLRCRTRAFGGFRQVNYVRDVSPFPLGERFGAFDGEEVATPSETLLAALGSCLSARIHANAAAASIVVHSLELDVEADPSPSPMWDPAGFRARPVGFEAIRVVVHIEAEASPESLDALIAHAAVWSPVANTLHDWVDLDVAMGKSA